MVPPALHISFTAFRPTWSISRQRLLLKRFVSLTVSFPKMPRSGIAAHVIMSGELRILRQYSARSVSRSPARNVTRKEAVIRVPNNPAAGKARIALLFAIVYHRPGLPEPGRSAR